MKNKGLCLRVDRLPVSRDRDTFHRSAASFSWARRDMSWSVERLRDTTRTHPASHYGGQEDLRFPIQALADYSQHLHRRPRGAPIRSFCGLESNGTLDLMHDPSDADLVLESQLIAPNGRSSGNKQNGASHPVPIFRLTIYDRKTYFMLWTLTQSIGVALLQKAHD